MTEKRLYSLPTTMRSSRQTVLFALGVALAAIALLLALPQTDSAAFMIALLCAVVGVIGISLLKDAHDRIILTRMFLAAFAVRIAFCVMIFKGGLTATFAGGDDAVWELGWLNSRIWRDWIQHSLTGPRGFNPSDFPTGFFDVYANVRDNVGYHYLASYFYYLLDVHSQLALAFLNCFIGALTVVMIYKIAREYFSEKACIFITWVAALLPALLIWSALTIKESWVIFFQITIFFAVIRCARRFSFGYVALIALLVFLTLGFRFYVAWCLIGGVIISFFCLRSQRPLRTAFASLGGVAALFVVLNLANVVRFDPSSIAMSQLKEINYFRKALTTASSRPGGTSASGTGSSITLDYDVTTPTGAIAMMGIGTAYLMLSPFPWQMTNLRQLLALPDVLVWYFLLFGFILPGIKYGWQRHRALVIAIFAFTLPLILFYSISFANFGLAYRQRAQLMPFLFILAAAGYERRRQEKTHARSRISLRTQPITRPTPTPVHAARASH